MVVGQDWGGIPYFRQFEGWDGPGNPTNDNLAELLKTISITITPLTTRTVRAFRTVLVRLRSIIAAPEA